MSIALRHLQLKLPIPGFLRVAALNKAATERIFRKLTGDLDSGSIAFKFDDGYRIDCGSGKPGPQAVMNIHSLHAVRRLVTGGYVGLAEGYMAGDWTTPSLPAVFDFGTANRASLDRTLSGSLTARLALAFSHGQRRNSRSGSRRNIAEHYDIGNDFFEIWLDPSMTYSSALYLGETGETLFDAQRNKYRRIVKELNIQPDETVLEIGCGWGGFAEFTARETGAHVTAITLSQEQHDYAERRIADAGLSKRVDVVLVDYRDVTGHFDHVVSIEMLEAVGQQYWPAYFKALANRLRAGGSAMIQVIVVPDDRFERYRNSVDFIQRYIFPGGMLLSPGKITEHGQAAGLTVEDVHMFGQSYSRTLDEWRSVFEKRWADIEPLGFDDRFKRMWEYYLAYTSAGFRAGTIDLGQFRLIKG